VTRAAALPASPRALIASAARRFRRAGLYFGHGTDNALDEAAFLVLHALGLPADADDTVLDMPLEEAGRVGAEKLLAMRLERRCPAAYLTQRMWFAGHEFYVDERVLVPRSPLAELINARFEPWLQAERVTRILDIGTGSGCIAVACALAFPAAAVDATDLSLDALAVATINRARHGLDARVRLLEADLFPIDGGGYDLIVSNPPYVPAARMLDLPQEYLQEPPMALVAGEEGFACVDGILAGAAAMLAPHGILVVEVGEIAAALDQRYGHLPLTWIEFEHGGEGVFMISREDLQHTL
jgi:ribosomal protein L3 glutamine methyltransferase